jgi:broad specificity phosphatase PhoE
VDEPEVWLVRHGETEWSRAGRHTSHTDLPLTPAGVDQARRLVPLVAGIGFDVVVASPRRRSGDTAALLGFPDARRDPDAVEWDYGDYEGRTTADIRTEVPDWRIWTHAAPGGETAAAIEARADRLIATVTTAASADGAKGRALVVAHGHFLRVLGARWIGQGAAFGIHLLLDTATLSILGWERGVPAIERWNVAAPVAPAPDSAAEPGAAGP